MKRASSSSGVMCLYNCGKTNTHADSNENQGMSSPTPLKVYYGTVSLPWVPLVSSGELVPRLLHVYSCGSSCQGDSLPPPVLYNVHCTCTHTYNIHTLSTKIHVHVQCTVYKMNMCVFTHLGVAKQLMCIHVHVHDVLVKTF